MSTIKFPQIEKPQVALIRAESTTGKVLCSNFERYQVCGEINNVNRSEAYTIFNTLEEAIRYIDTCKASYPNIEFAIKDCNDELIYFYSPFDWINPFGKK